MQDDLRRILTENNRSNDGPTLDAPKGDFAILAF
jgi:hypothetical protein